MLGIRLDSSLEERLARFAAQTRRSRSDIAREAVREYLDRRSMDEKIRHAAMLDAAERQVLAEHVAGDATDAWLRWLDAEDGGYDWGPAGPPQ